MVAPLDAKVTFDVEGEPITLRLNFRSIALAEKHGIDILNGGGIGLSSTQAAMLVKCLAIQEHPDFTEDHTMAIVARSPEALADALVELFTSYSGEPEGNGTGRKLKAV
jgi:hypothetical protein